MTFFEELLTLSTPPLSEMIRKGQALMLPLLVLFGLSLTIILDRALFWAGQLWALRKERKLLSAYQVEGHAAGLRGFLGERFGLQRMQRLLKGSILLRVLVAVEDAPGRDQVWEDEMDAVVSQSERFLSFLTLIATLGTSFGLLGTVIGVSKSLKFIESDFSQTVSGLSVALYTTIGGLVISIVSLSAYGVLSSLSDLLGRRIVDRAGEWKKTGGRSAPKAPPAPPPPSSPSASGRTPGLFEEREDTLAVSPAPRDLGSGDIVIEDTQS